MKTTQFYLAICFALIATSVDVKAQQQLLNGGFEITVSDTSVVLPPNIDVRPMYWRFGTTPDLIGCYPVFGEMSSDSHTGNHAIRLETIACPAYYTGFATNFSEISNSMHYPESSAQVVNARPDQLSFWHKYNPVNGDTAEYSVVLFNYPNDIFIDDPNWLYAIDTVGYVNGKISVAQDEYVQIVADFVYVSDEIPAYAKVFFNSNHNGYAFYDNLSHVHAGTTLWIDDVELIYLNTSVGEWSDSDFNIFPNPVTDRFQLNQAGDVKAKRMVLLNHVGQYVGELNPLDHFHAVDHLPPGMYFLQIETEQGVVVKKMVKE